MTEQPKFRWRLYYEDGTTFSDTDGKPHESPAWGAVIVSDRDKLLLGRNADYFLYDTKRRRWHQVGEVESEGAVSVGLVDHLAHNAHNISCVRPTRWMADDEEFKAVWARAQEELDA